MAGVTYVFDIDGTICTNTNGYNDYVDALPDKERIKLINNLHSSGNRIIFLTARGMGRTNNNREMAHDLFFKQTKNQLNEWGVKFHELYLGKPAGDVYVDDKGISDDRFFSNSKIGLTSEKFKS